MKTSVKWMQRFAPDSAALKAPIDELADKIGAQLGAIEAIEDLGEKYKGIIIAKIVSIADHPNADRLHVVMIDDGGVAQNVERDTNGHIQVVCGAQNLYEGMLVPWLPPGAVVPETVGKEPFVLEARELRGVKSNGMLASARELALGTDHSGIVGIDADAQPGDDFAKTYELDDHIIDIENKMFTHRPDLFGQLGVAREISGIYQQPFTSPAWYRQNPPLPEPDGETLPFEVHNELPALVPRFTALVMRDVAVKPSPLWLQTYLLRVGVRPISNIVDLTNYFMLLTGQPLHAYDYDKVKTLSGETPTIVVRYPHAGEQITLLNGKTIEPRPEAIMIATDKQAIGLGGVMGGAETEVDEHTKNIILECATFDMYSIRRTSMAHGLFTDAVTRFNKGQSPLQNLAVLAKVAEDVTKLAGGKVAGAVIDDNHVAGRVWIHPPVPVSASFINERLGLKLNADEVKQLLENVEFTVAVEGENLTVTAPFWRTDIEQREDVVEEVGRLYGYDHLPLELPTRIIEPTRRDPLFDLKGAVRGKLVRSGANEVLTYSFVHGNLLDKGGQDKRHAFQISNAISPDLQYYRLSLTPSLLDKVHANVKAGYDEFALFEMGRMHYKGEMDAADPQVPNEDNHVALVVAYGDKNQPVGAAYYYARKYLERIVDIQTLTFVPLKEFDLTTDEWGRQLTAPYEPNRSAVIVRDGQIWGVVGEFKLSVRKALKLPDFTAGFETHMDILADAGDHYHHLPRFPKVEQDICLKVSAETPYRTVYDFVARKVEELQPEQALVRLSPVDIYQRPDDQAHKQITLRLGIASYERTLTDEEVAKLLDQVAVAAKDTLHAERV